MWASVGLCSLGGGHLFKKREVASFAGSRTACHIDCLGTISGFDCFLRIVSFFPPPLPCVMFIDYLLFPPRPISHYTITTLFFLLVFLFSPPPPPHDHYILCPFFFDIFFYSFRLPYLGLFVHFFLNLFFAWPTTTNVRRPRSSVILSHLFSGARLRRKSCLVFFTLPTLRSTPGTHVCKWSPLPLAQRTHFFSCSPYWKRPPLAAGLWLRRWKPQSERGPVEELDDIRWHQDLMPFNALSFSSLYFTALERRVERRGQR